MRQVTQKTNAVREDIKIILKANPKLRRRIRYQRKKLSRKSSR